MRDAGRDLFRLAILFMILAAVHDCRRSTIKACSTLQAPWSADYPICSLPRKAVTILSSAKRAKRPVSTDLGPCSANQACEDGEAMFMGLGDIIF